MGNYFSVAIDGPSGAGKSSVAKAVAQRLQFIYVDTGAIYRTVALACFRSGVDCKDENQVTDVLNRIAISLRYEDGAQEMYLNGENVSDSIRLPEVTTRASDVSAHPAVRSFLLDMQRNFALHNNVIMDGRDIGTVVLPRADVKIFLTASNEARAQRRYRQLLDKGETPSYEKVLESIVYRDIQDTTRAAAPLKAAEDAVLVDTSEIDFNDSVNLVFDIIVKKLSSAEDGR